MSNNVEFQCCPKCYELNSAVVWCNEDMTYEIKCRECGFLFESGRLPWESVRLLDDEDLGFRGVEGGQEVSKVL